MAIPFVVHVNVVAILVSISITRVAAAAGGGGVHNGGGIQLIMVNNCGESVWPGILGSAGHPTPQSGGFHLGPGEETAFDVPTHWSGRVWPRRGCSFDAAGRHGSCATGDCGGGLLHCGGAAGSTPATVVEMTLGTATSPVHFYDVSLVDGFNLPVSMSPVGGGVGCGTAACGADLNVCCPAALEVRDGEGRVAGCRSACRAMGGDKYCCTGVYGSPAACRPTIFSHLFKAICPRAYSYAYDDASSLNRCHAKRYLITFCPPQPS
uniref:Thaumatin-like protein n=1 Tax=Leersia perrieri TaxID=77586 RepID=A0A0D9XVS1_9ORYZ